MESYSSDFVSPCDAIYVPGISICVAAPMADWQQVPFNVPSSDNLREDFNPNLLGFTSSDKDMVLQVHPSISYSVDLPGFSIDKLTALNNPTASKLKASVTTEYAGLEMRNQLEQNLTQKLHVFKTGPSIGKHTFCNTAMTSLPTDCIDGYARAGSRSNFLLNSLLLEHAAVELSSTANPHKSVVRHPVQATASGISTLIRVNSKNVATTVKHQAKVETLIETGGPLDKPHECTQCGLRFRKRCNAVNHLKIVRKFQALVQNTVRTNSKFMLIIGVGSWYHSDSQYTNPNAFPCFIACYDRREASTLQVRSLR